MTIIKKITDHYNTKEKLVISVPEWSDANQILKIYVNPMTMNEVNMVQKLSSKNSSNIEQAVNLLIAKARDAQNNRLFSINDKEALMNKADYQVITKIAEKIEAYLFNNMEQAKGNSEKIIAEETS